MIHELKTWKEYYDPIFMGRKTFEVRKNDRDFKVGDTLILIETDFGGNGMTDHDLTRVPTGRKLARTVSYILHGGQFGIPDDFVIISIQ
jgi:ASC-1-like (ASCH) protein